MEARDVERGKEGEVKGVSLVGLEIQSGLLLSKLLLREIPTHGWIRS